MTFTNFRDLRERVSAASLLPSPRWSGKNSLYLKYFKIFSKEIDKYSKLLQAYFPPILPTQHKQRHKQLGWQGADSQFKILKLLRCFISTTPRSLTQAGCSIESEVNKV